MSTTTAKEADHVLGVIPGSPRYETYKDVTLEMAELLLRDAIDDEEGTLQKDVTDLLDCFLMDAASIAATSDNRLLGMPGRSGSKKVRRDIATVYNHYRKLLLDDPSHGPRIDPFLPREKTPEAVTKDFQALALRTAAGMFKASPSIAKAES